MTSGRTFEPRRGASGLALLLAAAAGCSRETGPAARVAVAPTRHEFGRLWIGEVVRHPFRVANSGDLALKFGDVRSTCGCLLHQISTREVAPGGAAEIVAELHADRGPGRLEKMLRIATNDPGRPWLELVLGAELEVLYEIDPPLLDVQELVLGESAERVVTLTGRDGTELSFGTPVCPEKGFSASVRDATPRRAEIVLRFDGETRPGRRLFRLGVPTGHPRVPEATIAVQAVVHPRLTVEPGDRIDFGDVVRSRGARVEQLVRARGREPLASAPVATVELGPRRPAPPDRPAVEVVARVEPVVEGREWRLVVEIAPGSPGEGVIGRVSVRLDAPLEPPQTLTLAGRIVD